MEPSWMNQYVLEPSEGEKLDYWIKKNCADTDLEFIGKMTAKAMKYFGDNLSKAFAANIQDYVDEAFFHAMIKTVGEEDSEPPKTESGIFGDFVKISNSRLKERLDIRKASGRKSEYTDEELREMLSLYELMLPLIQEAKKHYTRVKDKAGWVQSIIALYPQLPVEIIEKFDQQGVSPAELALTLVAGRFNRKPTEYLRQMIIQTRASVDKNK